MVGIPTVLITLRPQASAEMGPPRALHPSGPMAGFTLGDSLGLPRQPGMQRRVLRAALARWEAREEPGTIWEYHDPWYQPDPAILNDGELIEPDK